MGLGFCVLGKPLPTRPWAKGVQAEGSQLEAAQAEGMGIQAEGEQAAGAQAAPPLDRGMPRVLLV